MARKAKVISTADKHEIRRYREAGIAIRHLAGMWHVSDRRILQILAELRELHGPEFVLKRRRQFVRHGNFMSPSADQSSTSR